MAYKPPQPPTGKYIDEMLAYKTKLERQGFDAKKVDGYLQRSIYARQWEEWKKYQTLIQKSEEAHEKSGVNSDRGTIVPAQLNNQAVQDKSGFTNPPFDKRIRQYIPGMVPAQQGYLEQAQFLANTMGLARPYRVRFLYNPESLSVSYGSSSDVLPAGVQSDEANAAQALIANMQRITFALFFDRTYEVNSMNSSGSQNVPEPYRSALNSGVYADIAALERVVGIMDGQGPVLKMPTRLYFGPRFQGPVGRNAPSPKPLSFFGAVESIDVTYSLFSKDMVPIRAQVNVGFMQMVQNKDAPDGYIRPTEAGVASTTTGATE
jgi:hypothetical protein